MKIKILLVILMTPSWIYAEVACSNTFLAEININDPRRPIYSSYSQTNPAVLNDVNVVRFSTGKFSSKVNKTSEEKKYSGNYEGIGLNIGGSTGEEVKSVLSEGGISAKGIGLGLSYSGVRHSSDSDNTTYTTSKNKYETTATTFALSLLEGWVSIGYSDKKGTADETVDTYETNEITHGFRVHFPSLIPFTIGRATIQEFRNDNSTETSRESFANGICFLVDGESYLFDLEFYSIDKPNYSSSNFGRELTYGKRASLLYEVGGGGIAVGYEERDVETSESSLNFYKYFFAIFVDPFAILLSNENNGSNGKFSSSASSFTLLLNYEFD